MIRNYSIIQPFVLLQTPPLADLKLSKRRKLNLPILKIAKNFSMSTVIKDSFIFPLALYGSSFRAIQSDR